MSLSRESSTSSISSSGSDFEDYYLFRYSPRTYKDEPYYYYGISDEEIHSCLNNEFKKVINAQKYGIAFSSKDILNDEGGNYIYIMMLRKERQEILPFLIHMIFLMIFLLMVHLFTYDSKGIHQTTSKV